MQHLKLDCCSDLLIPSHISHYAIQIAIASAIPEAPDILLEVFVTDCF